MALEGLPTKPMSQMTDEELSAFIRNQHENISNLALWGKKASGVAKPKVPAEVKLSDFI